MSISRNRSNFGFGERRCICEAYETILEREHEQEEDNEENDYGDETEDVEVRDDSWKGSYDGILDGIGGISDNSGGFLDSISNKEIRDAAWDTFKDEFGRGLKTRAEGLGRGVSELVLHPVDSAKKFGRGVADSMKAIFGKNDGGDGNAEKPSAVDIVKGFIPFSGLWSEKDAENYDGASMLGDVATIAGAKVASKAGKGLSKLRSSAKSAKPSVTRVKDVVNGKAVPKELNVNVDGDIPRYVPRPKTKLPTRLLNAYGWTSVGNEAGKNFDKAGMHTAANIARGTGYLLGANALRGRIATPKTVMGKLAFGVPGGFGIDQAGGDIAKYMEDNGYSPETANLIRNGSGYVGWGLLGKPIFDKVVDPVMGKVIGSTIDVLGDKFSNSDEQSPTDDTDVDDGEDDENISAERRLEMIKSLGGDF